MSEKIPYEQVMRRTKIDIDYIAEEARQKGFEEGLKVGYECGQHKDITLDYQRGLDDAWNAAKQLIAKWVNDDDDVFGDKSMDEFIETFSASEAIAKLKAYEEQRKADSEIVVGDEVTAGKDINRTQKGVVTYVSECKKHANVMWDNGDTGYYKTETEIVKTGRHFNFLTPLLNAMKGDAE